MSNYIFALSSASLVWGYNDQIELQEIKRRLTATGVTTRALSLGRMVTNIPQFGLVYIHRLTVAGTDILISSEPNGGCLDAHLFANPDNSTLLFPRVPEGAKITVEYEYPSGLVPMGFCCGMPYHISTTFHGLEKREERPGFL